MRLERTFGGIEVTLRPGGRGRFVSAALLLLWLGGWLVGEVVVVGLLGAGAWKLLNGSPIISDGTALSPAGVILIAGFMLLWLGIWTIGGVAAAAEVLRLLWSEDRFVISHDALELTHRRGPGRKRVLIARPEIRSIQESSAGRLIALLRREARELSSLGTPGERTELRRVLLDELQIPATGRELPPELPSGWQEITRTDDVVVITRDLAMRRKQAVFTWALATAGIGAVIVAVAFSRDEPVLLGLFLTVAVLLVWGATSLTWGRREWHVSPRQVELVSRFRARERRRFVGHGLELERSRDSDGDAWFRLVAVGRPPASGRVRRRTILNCMNEDHEPRMMGQWLASRTGLAVIETSR